MPISFLWKYKHRCLTRREYHSALFLMHVIGWRSCTQHLSLFPLSLPSSLPPLAQMELKKSLVEHMVHLLTCGHVLPVVDYINHCMQLGSLDQSHIRHFVSEVLSVIQRPYSPDFSDAFEPLLHNHEITAPLINADKSDPVSEFLGTYTWQPKPCTFTQHAV